MTEKDILDLIKRDKWMMDILRVAEKLNLPDWIIGAGFIRNKVWDYLQGYNKSRVDTVDIDFRAATRPMASLDPSRRIY